MIKSVSGDEDQPALVVLTVTSRIPMTPIGWAELHEVRRTLEQTY